MKTLKHYNGNELLERRVGFPIVPFDTLEGTTKAELGPVIVAGLFICIVATLETVLAAKIAGQKNDYPFCEKQELGALSGCHALQVS